MAELSPNPNPGQANPNPANLPGPGAAAQPLLENLKNLGPQNPENTETKIPESTGKKLYNNAISLTNIGQLLATAPVIFTSFINQADNIAEQGERANNEGWIGFATQIINVISTPFRGIWHRFVAKSEDPDDVTANRRSFLSDDIIRRLLHPNLAKHFTNLIFDSRRILFNLFPKSGTVPSEDHDPDNPQGHASSSFSAKLYGSLSTLLSPFRIVTSLAAAGFSLPTHILGLAAAYTGDQAVHKIADRMSRVSSILSPIVANLSSLYSTAKAHIESWANGDKTKQKSLDVSYGKYNIGITNIFQGLIGSVISIPYFFSVMLKFRERLFAKGEDGQYLFEKHTRNLVEAAFKVRPVLAEDETVSTTQDRIVNFVRKFFTETDNAITGLLDSLYNAGPGFQRFFGRFRPTDVTGRVISIGSSKKSIESDSASEKVFGLFNKGNLFNELYDILHPIQSLLMLLPNALVPLSDPYVSDNAKRPLRVFDRLLGINSMILSLPNYLVYALSTRIPQVMLKYYEMKQRAADAQGESYDAVKDFHTVKEALNHIPFIGSSFLGQNLKNLDINERTFKDSNQMDKVYKDLEHSAHKQESSLKASELVGETRIWMRRLIGKGWFYAERDDDGLTGEEHSRMKIHKSLGTLKEGIGRIPVLGWVAAPLVEMIRRFYFVKPRRIRRLTSEGLPVPEKKQAANPLEQLASMLGGKKDEPLVPGLAGA